MISPKYSIFLVQLIIVLICASLNEAEESDYIVGGSNAKGGELPYQISLQSNKHHICGGSIYSNCWILTAAHCVSGKNTASLSILAGTTKLNKGGVRATIDKIIMHPSYKPTINNDIALIKLKKCLPKNNKNIKPIKMLRTQNIGQGVQGLVSGWGYTDQDGKKTTNDLKKLKVTTISNQQCSKTFGNIPSGVLCAYNKVKQGFCQGDSGGPLVDLKSKNQMGIVSANVPCARGRPDIYTRISTYIQWIERTAK